MECVVGVIFYPDDSDFLHISDKAVCSCVHRSSAFNFLQELFLSIHNLAVC